jgi:hypothetical protein
MSSFVFGTIVFERVLKKDIEEPPAIEMADYLAFIGVMVEEPRSISGEPTIVWSWLSTLMKLRLLYTGILLLDVIKVRCSPFKTLSCRRCPLLTDLEAQISV